MSFYTVLIALALLVFFLQPRRKKFTKPSCFIKPIEPLTITSKLTIEPEESAYKKRSSVMSRSESAFFYELKKQLPSDYYIFPKMRIADMIDTVDGKGFYFRRNKILPKHVDFLVCNEYFKPVVAIEVNGNSHNRADRVERDVLVNEIFKNAKLPLETVNVGTDFSSSIARIKENFYN
jgi:hypothetical protein